MTIGRILFELKIPKLEGRRSPLQYSYRQSMQVNMQIEVIDDVSRRNNFGSLIPSFMFHLSL